MPDIHVSMLAVHVPNLLPKYVPWIDFARHRGFYINSPLAVGAPRRPHDLVDAHLRRSASSIALRLDEEAEAGRARHLGADNSRRDGRVGR